MRERVNEGGRCEAERGELKRCVVVGTATQIGRGKSEKGEGNEELPGELASIHTYTRTYLRFSHPHESVSIARAVLIPLAARKSVKNNKLNLGVSFGRPEIATSDTRTRAR